MVSEYFQGEKSWDEWQTYGLNNYSTQPQTGGNSWQMYGLYNYPTQPQTGGTSWQMYGLNNSPIQPQPPWDDDALRQLRPKLQQLDMTIPEHSSHNQRKPTPRKILTGNDRKKVCQYHEDHPSATHQKIAEYFEVERSTISKILKNKEQHLQHSSHDPRKPTPRKILSDNEREKVCQYHEDHPSATQTKMAGYFEVERSTISRILKNKEQHLQQFQKQSADVDALMRAIQAKPAGDSSREAATGEKSARARDAAGDGESGRGGCSASADTGENLMKGYKCYNGESRKAFFHKSPLETHIRAHTGEKPYTCTYRSCTHAFSQLSNLKTHLRRYTGERPLACPTCGKTFPHSSDVRVHAAVHNAGGIAKKYVCRLNGCGERYTRLGALKSHMDEFHVKTLRGLTATSAESEARGGKEAEEDELLEYFRSHYRNANKAIKGRGKGRKVASTAHNIGSTATSPPLLSSSTSSLFSLASLPPSLESISYTGGIPAHFNMGIDGVGMGAGMEMEIFEEMFARGVTGTGNLCGSSLGSFYEVGTYKEDDEGELAFGDRQY